MRVKLKKSGVVILTVFLTSLVFGACTQQKTTSQASPTPTSVAQAVSNETIFTLDEIAKHNSKSSCYLAIDGNVYDVTSFIPRHPGGEKILMGCGTDATSLFEKIGHDEKARANLPSLMIGKLK